MKKEKNTKQKVKGSMKKRLSAFFHSQKFRYGSIATLFTVIVLVAIFVVNVIATVVTNKYPVKVDLTQSKAFQLTEETMELLKGLDTDVEITLLENEQDFASYNSYFAQANEILKLYSKHSSRIKVNYLDLDKNPSKATQYTALGATTGDLVFQTDKNSKVVSLQNLFNLTSTSSGSYISSSKAELAISSALLSVTSDVQHKVTFITGHEEASLSALETLLESNNFQVNSVSLDTGNLDEDTEIVVISAPLRDFSADELKKLDAFLTNDGAYDRNIIYVASHDQDISKLPLLTEFLAEWGIGVSDTLACETDANYIYNSNPFFTKNSYLDLDFAGKLANNGVACASYVTRPLTLLFESQDNRRTYALIGTSESAVGYPIAAANSGDDLDISTLAQGVQNVAVQGTKTVDGHTSSIVAFGSPDFFSETLLTSSVVANSDYTTQTFRQLVGEKDNTLNISAKTLDGGTMSLTAAQSRVIGLIFVIILPLAVILLGIRVWLRRRHR